MDQADGNVKSVKAELLDEAFSWAKMIIFAVVFALAVNNFVIVNATVPTGSMKNTIMVDDRLVAFRLSYLFSEPKRFDIVVFRYPDDETEYYVKRIIGLPGETVTIKEGRVYIDGASAPLPDDFVREPPFGEDYGPYTVPEGRYFMMGDNRNDSQDSRFWSNKYVAKDKILGKVILKYYKGVKLLYNA
jgi:signal peptidase I